MYFETLQSCDTKGAFLMEGFIIEETDIFAKIHNPNGKSPSVNCCNLQNIF